jgi:hypothetical protein
LHLEIPRPGTLPRWRRRVRSCAAGRPDWKDIDMQDLIWIGLVLALLALTLGYAALCDRA